MISALCIVISSVVALFVGISVYIWRTSWKPYLDKVEHDPREGNPTMPPTYRWLEWLLSAYVWKTATIFEATESGIFVGVVSGGKARLYKQFVSGKKFAVKLPREHRTYFAVNTDGRRVKIRIAEHLIPVTDPRFSSIPLF
ncbi:MAG: hypothetical protein ABIO72_03650 [Patescibacteria group bacterium]